MNTYRLPTSSRAALALAACAAALAALSCNVQRAIVGAIVPVPDYPNFESEALVQAEAERMSDALEAHVDAWLDGRGPAAIPAALVPDGISPGMASFRLARPGEVRPEDYWFVRPAAEVNDAALQGQFPDPHATYLVLLPFYAPFGHACVIEGEFPHARFFDVQASPPFDPAVYVYDGALGAPEVPIVDADIEPLPGHTNPFRVGADRGATRRGYRVQFDLKRAPGAATPVDVEPAFRPPFRGGGNRRAASALNYQGPWGEPGGRGGHNRGAWDVGRVWVRYYAPDRGRGPLAGVPLPRVHYETPDGRSYVIVADIAEERRRLNLSATAKATDPKAPDERVGSDIGWFKSWGIFHSVTTGFAQSIFGIDSEPGREYVRELDLGVTGRGQDQPPPGDYALSASDCSYIHYLTRGMALEDGYVAVVAGRMPSTPATRDGEARMTGAEARYWSLTGYDPSADNEVPGFAVHSVMDDEVLRQPNGDYVIAFSRPRDRPRNAAAASGVTWVDWGRLGMVSWTLRWMTVAPEWEGRGVPHPTERALTWGRTAWSSETFDWDVVSRNNREGFLGAYQPVVHYMTRAEFEALGGGTITPEDLPKWTSDGAE